MDRGRGQKAIELKLPHWRRISACAALILALGRAHSCQAQAPLAGAAASAPAEAIALPQSVPDPIEPVNRVIWAFNRGLMTDVIAPSSRVYRFVVPRPVRTGIGNIGRNLYFPQRFINNLLQGKWRRACDETYRFLCNTTVGLGGFFDAADTWTISVPKADADFGQTLGLWGWRPHCYLMLPLFGPSNERDTVGLAGDTAVNPLLYIAPYRFNPNSPLSYLGRYSYLSYAFMYNDFSDTVGEFVRFSQSEMDPYAEIQYDWTFARESKAPDFQVKGEPDAASLETLASVLFTGKDPEFLNHGQTRSVVIPATGRKLKFTSWVRPGKAPLVYIVPGLGSHRLSQPSLALAELAYNNGCSVVCVSSPFNAEFMEHASTVALPAYLPVDGHDLHAALTAIDHRLQTELPGRFGPKTLMGYSMGALESLYIAATAATNPSLISFERYVAIDTPVTMLHGISKLDEFYRAPLAWPAAERADDLENTLLKVAALSKGPLSSQTLLPFSATESKFLIGLTFRLILRDVIFSSQRRVNQGVLRQPVANLRREPVYQEILRYSYEDYFQRFAAPYYQARGIASAAEVMEKDGDLRTYTTELRGNPHIRLIYNQNDFLLTPDDSTWLRATFAPDATTIFPHGGHLGNLFDPAVQTAVLDAVAGVSQHRVESK